jgi:uncharacterized membrane protein
LVRSFATLRHRIEGLSRRSRRMIGVASILALPFMFVWSALWQTTRVPNYLWGPVTFLFVLTTVCGALVLYWFVRDRANSNAHLDERQSQLRDQAFVLSYEVLSAVVIVAVVIVGVMVLGMERVVTLDGTVVTAIVICAGVLIPLLPVAALAWVEPDAPGEA